MNAVGDVALADFVRWLDGEGDVPSLVAILEVDLGSVRGVSFGFTDAATMPDGRLAFIAGAEDSPDTYRDGEVVGCRFGFVDGDRVSMTDVKVTTDVVGQVVRSVASRC